MSKEHTILRTVVMAGELYMAAIDEMEEIVEKCMRARAMARDGRLERFYDNELVEEIERRGYPVGRKDIMSSIILREATRLE